MVNLKFKCIRKSELENGYEVELKPVTGTSLENESYFKWTPYGNLTLGLVNKNTANDFVVGESYYIDINGK